MTHLGSPSHKSQTTIVCLVECNAIAPNSHVSMHHAQPLHFASSSLIIPVSSSLERAFLGQDLTHVGSSQRRQAMDIFKVGSIRIVRMRDSNGLNPCSFTAEQMYSQIRHPVHVSGSETTYLRCILVNRCLKPFPRLSSQLFHSRFIGSKPL